MWAEGDPHTIAVTQGELSLTYEELRRCVETMAAAIGHDHGVVAIKAGNTFGPIVVALAAFEIGRPVAFLPPAATPGELTGFRALLGRATEVDEDGTVIWAATGQPSLHHPDAALVAFTSGSTGEPRAVQISRAHLNHNTANCIDMVGMRETREQILYAPISHLFALFGHVFPGLKAGLTTHLLDGVAEARALIERGAASGILSGVPTHWEALLRYCRPDPALYRRITQIVSSGSPLSKSLRQRLAERFANATILNGYGLSESPRILALSSLHPRFFSDATGLPTPGAELSLSTDGELLVRGKLVMLGYLGAPDATAARFRDGWMCTGDAARYDEDGVFTVLGRLDDIRKVGAERISLVEVDEALLQLLDVEDAAATVETDDLYGERLVAFLRGGRVLAERSRAELRDALAHRLAWPKVPTRFFLTNALPRNRAGKIVRGRLGDIRESAREIL
jgi:acyl-CoA synthetase (AMP-forming)/AMP-acid ligase II